MGAGRQDMKNEYGVTLDSNGYAPSIIPDPMPEIQYCGCYVCGIGGDLARHEVFPGTFRTNSKRYGLWINLCPRCHEAVHKHQDDHTALKKVAQKVAMNYYGWTVDDFRKRFGKNWL